MKNPCCLQRGLTLLLCLGMLAPVMADEGMWMPGNLGKSARRTMKELGMKLSPKELYHPRRPSLKDAVVSFGGFCSGVVVSDDGLVLTNHHCGFDCIAQHSTLEHDYLTTGFAARTRAEELPNPGLYVRFLVEQKDVTRRVLRAVTPGMSEEARTAAVDSVCLAIEDEVVRHDSTLVAMVDSYYGGNEYWLSTYRDYDDVRLVFAPPSAVGKFGWDRDNWAWPRHTGDFAVFRIYARPGDNMPAPYSPANVPYHPARAARVSLDGLENGEVCMTMGYPGQTGRRLSSFAIDEALRCTNAAQTDMRRAKLAIWKRQMERSDSIRLKYAVKYNESSNYYKHSIGMAEGARRTHLLEKKRAQERRLAQWLRLHPGEGISPSFMADLELAYRSRADIAHAQAYLSEAFFNGPELLQLAMGLLSFDPGAGQESVAAQLESLAEMYANLDPDIDREVFAALLKDYRSHVADGFLPDMYQVIDRRHQGDTRAFADSLYRATRITDPAVLARLAQPEDTTFNLYDDPAVSLAIDLLSKYFEISFEGQEASARIQRGERLYDQAMRRMGRLEPAYPDANATFRLSFGTVRGYSPADGVDYASRTTARGILEKARAYKDDPDFSLPDSLALLLQSPPPAPYAGRDGQLPVCLLTTNDITGGNSGSAMFNAEGEVVGLAFDGNWEGIPGDYAYDPLRQRTIGVDIRYMLFIIKEYMGAAWLADEMLAGGTSR